MTTTKLSKGHCWPSAARMSSVKRQNIYIMSCLYRSLDRHLLKKENPIHTSCIFPPLKFPCTGCSTSSSNIIPLLVYKSGQNMFILLRVIPPGILPCNLHIDVNLIFQMFIFTPSLWGWLSFVPIIRIYYPSFEYLIEKQ